MLPAEWEPQRFVQLTWPHADTDWAPYLDAAQECFLNIARAITLHEPLLVVTPSPEDVEAQLREGGVDMSQVVIEECPTNDTWARDHAFICTREPDKIGGSTDDYVEGGGNIILHDFTFNGWGMKFAANLDNQINRTIYDDDTFADNDILDIWDATYQDNRDKILEGGSIESDGKGTILTTTECLLSANRNIFEGKSSFKRWFFDDFGAQRVLWLDDGFLLGDDTDSHIDTLARFCPNDTIVYVKCEDPDDIHYEALKQMEEQLKGFSTVDGKPFRLLALPLPAPILESDFPDAVASEGDQRLPATYANFLVINGAVLYPTYNQPDNDQRAAEVLQEAFPDREIIGIDCRVLIRQHGSLHCVTMQYPK